jgi:hypothetical protein
VDNEIAVIDGIVDSILEDTGTTLPGTLATIDGIVDSILLDTAEIGTAGAGLTALATQASVNTIDDFLDTEIAAILADTNELQTDWANGGRLDLILDIIAADTTTDIPALIADVPTVAEFNARTLVAADYTVVSDLGTVQTGDSFARLGAPAGASVSADVAAVKAQTAAIEADTQDLQTQIGTDGAGLTNMPWNAAWDAEVQSECAAALNAYDPPTKAELDTAVANVSVDEIQASALADLFNTDSGTTYAAAVDGSVVAEIADNAGGSSLTAGGIADAVWDEALSGHSGAGSAGAALSAAGTAGDPWITALPGSYGSGTAGNILGNRLVGTIASGTHNAQSGDAYARLGAPAGASVSADVAAVKSDTAAILTDTGTTLDTLIKDIPTVAEFEARTLVSAGYATAAALTTVDNEIAVIDGIVDAILVDTAEIGTAGAGLTAIPSNETDGSVSAA